MPAASTHLLFRNPSPQTLRLGNTSKKAFEHEIVNVDRQNASENYFLGTPFAMLGFKSVYSENKYENIISPLLRLPFKLFEEKAMWNTRSDV